MIVFVAMQRIGCLMLL